MFKRTGGEFSTSVRPTRGILLVLSNCTDPSREEEFNRWYEDIHFPDILNVGQFHTAYRYENVNPESSAKYLAIYETDNAGPADARKPHTKLMEGCGRLLALNPGGEFSSPHDWLGDYPQAGGGVGDHEHQHRVLASQGAGVIGHLSQGNDMGHVH